MIKDNMTAYPSWSRIGLLLCMVFLFCCLNLTACTKNAPLVEQAEPIEDELAISAPTFDESDLVWRVEPTLEYDKIYYCAEGMSFCTEDHNGDKIDIETGQAIGPWRDGHGGYIKYFLYDEKKALYGYYSTDEDDESIYLRSENDFIKDNYWYCNRLNAFQKIDSDKIKTLSYEFEGSWITTYDLSDAYISDKYAIAYGVTFVSDFIYDDNDSYSCAYVYYDVNDFIAIRLNNKWGVLDKDGSIVVPFMFDDILLIDEETAFAKYSGKYGILDIHKTSTFVTPAQPTNGESAVNAAENRGTYITTDNVNLREGSGTDSARITTAPKGTTVKVIGFLGGEWYLVEYEGQTGYMKAEFLTKDIFPNNGLFSKIELYEIIHYLEDNYAEIHKGAANRDYLGIDIKEIEIIGDTVHIEYDFYENAEGWSLRIGTAIIGKNDNDQPYIISDEVDKAAMERVEKAMQEWGGLETKTEENPADTLDKPEQSPKQEITHDYSKILTGDLSDFTGVWTNYAGEKVTCKSDGTLYEDYTIDGITYKEKAEGFEKQEDGSYTWLVNLENYDGPSGYGVSLFPIGVEVWGYDGLSVRDITIIPTDTTKVRLYAGHGYSPDMANEIYYLE